MRKIYLDNIRWSAVLLVMLYHIFYMFNSAGVPGGIGSFQEIQYQDALLYFVYPWFMLLLFLIAGISARYALQNLSAKEFLKKRTRKLLIPSTLGLFAFQWIVGYYNIKIGGGLAYIPAFLVYPISAVSGIGPLWFAQTLWLFSLLLVLIKKIDKNDFLWKLGENCNFAVLLLLALLLWGSSHILNMPVLIMYRFGIYFTAFLLGYFVFSHDCVQETLEKYGVPLLLVSIPTGILYTVAFFGQNYSDTTILESLFTSVYAWPMVLAVLGCGRKWMNGQNKFSRYMTGAGYGFYVLHYAPTLLSCYYLKQYTALPVWGIYALAVLIVFTGTPVLYEMMKKIPVLKYFVLGINTSSTYKK